MTASRIIFIAGPTASGKSAAALALGEKLGGEIINADAMQIYSDLRIVTARPSDEDQARIPHHLYGVLDGAEANSAGRWSILAAGKIEAVNAAGKVAILVGGTGLYFRALEDGLSPIPETPPAIRDRARQRREVLGATAFRDEVLTRDPEMARLPEGDTQRLLRAWEVFEATGEPLSHFQKLPRQPLITGGVQKAVLLPDRAALYARCDARAALMLQKGAIAEVEALLARGLEQTLPVMRALGVADIADLINERVSHEAALTALQQNTRRFAKRQTTWVRNQMAQWPVYETGKELVAAL